MLSFPLPGATLALDFPNKGESTRRLLDRMADVVLAAGGRLYPAKDATMSGAAFRAGYPAWRTVEAQRDPGHHVRLLAPRDRGGRMSKILILGATSAIAQAYARRRAAQGASFILAGRRRSGSPRLRPISRLAARRQAAEVVRGRSRRDREDRRERCRAITARFGAPDEVLLAYGMLGEQAAAEQDLAQARALIDTNFTSAALWILALLKRQAGAQARSPSSASARSRATAAAPATSSTARPRPASIASSKGLAHKHDGSPVSASSA